MDFGGDFLVPNMVTIQKKHTLNLSKYPLSDMYYFSLLLDLFDSSNLLVDFYFAGLFWKLLRSKDSGAIKLDLSRILDAV